MGFFGMNMAMQAGGANAADLLNAGAAGMAAGQQFAGQQGQPGQPVQPQMGQPQAAPVQDAAAAQPGRWFCPNCGNENYGNFCVNCGTKRP